MIISDNVVKVYDDSVKYFNVDGELHRTDGPAVIYLDDVVEYWVDGVKTTRSRMVLK